MQITMMPMVKFNSCENFIRTKNRNGLILKHEISRNVLHFT